MTPEHEAIIAHLREQAKCDCEGDGRTCYHGCPCSILRVIDELTQQVEDYQRTDKEAILEAVWKLWEEAYPGDIFTGVSGETGPVRVASIREFLLEIRDNMEHGKAEIRLRRNDYV